MNDKSPSDEEWRDLYHAAMEFKKIESWNWMWDSDMFGVQNPSTGEIGYCCVMGRLGEHFALGVYLGTEGLGVYLKMESGEISQSSPDMLHVQKCLTASFEDRKFLRDKDIQVIRMLGLKFRGHNSWPQFSSFRPGYHPWYLTSEEAKYLTLALHQAIDVSLRFRNNPRLLNPPMKNQHLVRVPEKEKDGLKWKDEWKEPHPLKEVEIVVQPLDENRLRRINGTVTQRRGVWEIDCFFSPQGVWEKQERPFYPFVIMTANHYSGLILDSALTEPAEGMSELPRQFMKLAENSQSLPMKLLVRKEEVFKLLGPVAHGLRVELVKRLTAVEAAHTSMLKFFDGQKQ
jgi:hypothetical protein